MVTIVGKPITQNGFGLMSMPLLPSFSPIILTNLTGLTWAQNPTFDDVAFAVLKAALAAGANGK